MNLFKTRQFIYNSLRHVRDVTKRVRLRELYNRRMEVGPEKPIHRSDWSNWNYKSELYAFGKRLGENFDNNLLIEAFIDKSSNSSNDSINNQRLYKIGNEFTEKYVRNFLFYHFNEAPLEWLIQIKDFLLSDEMMGKISGHIGTRDLIISPSVEVQLEAEADALFAIIGALYESQGEIRTIRFINDFILTQLTQFHLCDIIKINKPKDLLTGVLRYYKKPDPEARILRQSGINSVFACYTIGIYSDRELIGEAAGESINEATTEACSQSLRNLFGLSETRSPIDFKRPELEISINSSPNQLPIREEEYLKYLVM